MKQPLVYTDQDAVFVSWDDGRSWWEMNPTGSVLERFRHPPERARRVSEPCDIDCCVNRTDERLDRLAAGCEGDDALTTRLAAWRDEAREGAPLNDMTTGEGVVRP